MGMQLFYCLAMVFCAIRHLCKNVNIVKILAIRSFLIPVRPKKIYYYIDIYNIQKLLNVSFCVKESFDSFANFVDCKSFL